MYDAWIQMCTRSCARSLDTIGQDAWIQMVCKKLGNGEQNADKWCMMLGYKCVQEAVQGAWIQMVYVQVQDGCKWCGRSLYTMVYKMGYKWCTSSCTRSLHTNGMVYFALFTEKMNIFRFLLSRKNQTKIKIKRSSFVIICNRRNEIYAEVGRGAEHL